MNNKLINNMINNGYTAIINCIDKKIIKEAQENINNTLKKLRWSKKTGYTIHSSRNLKKSQSVTNLRRTNLLNR